MAVYPAPSGNPTIARWHVPDPLAHEFAPFSPYSYCLGNPVNFIDPDGREVVVTNSGATYTGEDMLALWRYLVATQPSSVRLETAFFANESGGGYMVSLHFGYSGGISLGSANMAFNRTFGLLDGYSAIGVNHPKLLASATVGFTDPGGWAVRLGAQGGGDITFLENYYGVNYFLVKGVNGAVAIPEIGVFMGTDMYNTLTNQNRLEELKAYKQHEYGHILQYQANGEKLYWGLFAPLSLVSAIGHILGLHNHYGFFIEVDANKRAVDFFGDDKSKYFGTNLFPTTY